MRREYIWATLFTLLILPLASCSRVVAHANTTPSEGVPVRTARAVLEDVPLEIAAVGNVAAIESVEVKPRIGGQIRSVAFTEGQQVTKGQLLFIVDRDTLYRQWAQHRRSWLVTRQWSSRQKRWRRGMRLQRSSAGPRQILRRSWAT